MTSSTTSDTHDQSTNPEADVAHHESNPVPVPVTQDTGATTEAEAGMTAVETSESDHPERSASGNDAAENKTRPADKRSEKDKLQNAIHGTSYKDQPTLIALQKRLQKLTSESDNTQQQELSALAHVLEQRLDEYLHWQQKLIKEIENGISLVVTRINDGKVTEAQSQLDRSQSQLRKINIDEQPRLLAQITPLREELAKLLDWKKFASSEKKKELIDKMQALIDDGSAPPQKAKLIRALQDEWKTLGHSDDNDALWLKFSDLARVAFEPCKTYFKERKDKQAANLIARNNLCEQLEAYAATLSDTSTEAPVNLNELTRLENQAREDWKKYAPVAQNKINALQSRFNAVLSTLKQHRRQALHSHNAAKLALITQARQLVNEQDLPAAIQQAKTLQQQWKDLGPGSFKDDRKLWTDFRAACDALFARREETSKQKRQHTASASSAAARDVLKKLNALIATDDETFSDSKAAFAALSSEFREALTPDLKNERKALQEQFNKLSRQYDNRLRLTPDKKMLQLIQQVQMQADFCRVHEEALLVGTEPETTAEQLEQHWQAFEKINDDTLQQSLNKRFRQLLQYRTDQKLPESATEKAELRGRELCVEIEIMIGAETPSSDKAIRMQQQLNQLQRGLGRMPPNHKEKADRIQSAELELLALGPLPSVTRASLQHRLQQLKQKL